jgi:hypothetical protein
VKEDNVQNEMLEQSAHIDEVSEWKRVFVNVVLNRRAWTQLTARNDELLAVIARLNARTPICSTCLQTMSDGLYFVILKICVYC